MLERLDGSVLEEESKVGRGEEVEEAPRRSEWDRFSVSDRGFKSGDSGGGDSVEEGGDFEPR